MFYLPTVKTNDYQCIDVIGKDLSSCGLSGLTVETVGCGWVSPSANSGDQDRKKVAQDRENII